MQFAIKVSLYTNMDSLFYFAPSGYAEKLVTLPPCSFSQTAVGLVAFFKFYYFRSYLMSDEVRVQYVLVLSGILSPKAISFCFA